MPGTIKFCAKYALYPVWLLNTSWEGKQYYFAMNGRNGKFVGDLPVDKKAAVLLIVSSFTAVALALEEGFSGE